MNKTEEIVKKILSEGGSIYMHKNDIERLKESRIAGNSPDIFSGVKIYADKLGAIKEGEPLAAKASEGSRSFNFRDQFY